MKFKLKFWKISLLTLLIIIFVGKGNIFSLQNIPKISHALPSQQILAQTTNSRKMEADQLLQQGIEQLASEDNTQVNLSLSLFEQALTIYREIQDRGGEGQALKNISIFYFQQQNYTQALEYTQQTLSIAQEIQDADLEARAFNNRGLIYYTQNNYTSAIESYQSGLIVMQQVSNQELELKLNYNLANAYKDSNNYSDAVTHYENALVTAKEVNELYAQYGILNSLAEMYLNSQNNEQANIYYQQAFEVAKQIDAKELNSFPQEDIAGIKVPSVFSVSLQGEIDGTPFENLAETLEIRPIEGQDPNPFLVALYRNKTSPEDNKFGEIFWQSYSAGHPQEQEHYSRVSVTNGQARIEINPTNGNRSDVMWSTNGSLFDDLRNFNDQLNEIEQEFNLPKEEDEFEDDIIPIPNQPNRSAVVPRSGVLAFSIQGNRIIGTINASGISEEGQVSDYQAEFAGEIISKQSNNRIQDSLKGDDFEAKNTDIATVQNSVPNSQLKKHSKKKLSDINSNKNLSKEDRNSTLSFQGTKKTQFQNIKSTKYNQKRLEEIFINASWVFFDDGTFLFAPSANADVRDDLYPILGNYTQDKNTLVIRGDRESFGASASIDGTISLTKKEPHLDVIYSISSHSYNIVKISQALTPKNIKLDYDLPSTEIEGIKVPSTYKIALQGEIDGQSVDNLYGFLKIKPNNSFKQSNHPFVITLQIYAPDKNGSLEWISEEVFTSNSGEIIIDSNQISLELKPNLGTFSNFSWWASPTGYAQNVNTSPVIVISTEGNLTFTIDNDLVSGTISATGESAAWQTSTYQASFKGERETKPPSFQGIWQENKFLHTFGDINLEQSGQKVTGTYSANSGGVIEGIAQGNRLDFTWKDVEKEGKGFFRLTSHGKFLIGILFDNTHANQQSSFVAKKNKESYSNLVTSELANNKWYLNDLGMELMLQHRYKEALIPLETAQELHHNDRKLATKSTSKNYNYLSDQASVIRNLTRSYFQTKKYNNLIKSLGNAIEVQRLIDKDKSYNFTPYDIKSISDELNKYIESWRKSLTQDKDKIAALDQAQPFFKNLITYLVELDTQDDNSLTPEYVKSRKLEVALLASENARARAFADLLKNQVSSDSVQAVTANPPTIKQIKKIAKEHNATLVEYWVDEAKASNKELTPESKIYIWVIQPDGKIDFRSVNLPHANKPLAQFVADTRDFMGVGQEDSNDDNESISKVKESKNRGKTIESSWKPGDLVRLKTDLVEYLREIVAVYPDRNSVTVRFFNEPGRQPREVQISELVRVYAPINIRLQQFYQLLIDPIAELLPTNPEAKVIFIPHQELFLLPFPAFQDQQGKYLIEQHTILTSPAIQILGSTHQRRKQIRGKAKESIVVGNPNPMPGNFAPIKGAEKEAKAVAKQLRVQPLIGTDATEKNIIQKLSQAKLIHLATHGTFNSQDPLQGVIALAPSADGYDGMLTAEKILNLDNSLNAELVVLSACDTGRGKISGDGVIGLSRSWMAAGVPSMIVSLWQVPDEKATPLLMDKFYESYHKQGLNKAQSLQKAMLETKNQYPDPRDWAAFTLIGEAE